jgi:RND family efflux transporter MFP subunit
MHDFHSQPPTPTMNRPPNAFRRFLPVLVLASAIGLAMILKQTPPRPEPRPLSARATLVEVEPVTVSSRPAVIPAMGTVRPDREIELMPRVSGEILSVSESFIPGGLFRKEEVVLKIEPVDYELAKRQAEKTLAQAKTDLRMEQGNQEVAKKDFELLNDVMAGEDTDLVLRKPQLAMAQASLDSAKAELERARLDLDRTTVRAPFNAVVGNRTANIGARVSPTSALATLIGTDTYWVEVTVPVNQLKWIRIPQEEGDDGSIVRIYDEAAWGAGVFRTGKVRRLAASLEEQGRMARLIVTVDEHDGHHRPCRRGGERLAGPHRLRQHPAARGTEPMGSDSRRRNPPFPPDPAHHADDIRRARPDDF